MALVTVTIWQVDLDQPIAVVDALRAWLDDAETRAAAARRDDGARHRFVVAHAALRGILGATLGIEPAAVELSRRCERCGDPSHGRPVLAAGGDCTFSLSHSGPVALVAVARGARVGVDVEVERPRARLDALAERVLDAEAFADWLDTAPGDRLRAFLARWTAKEAYLKAIGTGITVPLRDVPSDPDGWTVASAPAPPGAVASVAVEGSATIVPATWCPPPPESGALGHRPIDKFRDTAVGAVLAAGLLGLRDVLEPRPDEEVAIVQDWSGAPPFRDPFVLRLDPDHPEDSIVMVRTWLRRPGGSGTTGA